MISRAITYTLAALLWLVLPAFAEAACKPAVLPGGNLDGTTMPLVRVNELGVVGAHYCKDGTLQLNVARWDALRKPDGSPTPLAQALTELSVDPSNARIAQIRAQYSTLDPFKDPSLLAVWSRYRPDIVALKANLP